MLIGLITKNLIENLILEGGKKLIKHIKNKIVKPSPYTGIWIDEIYDHSDKEKIIKIDCFEINHDPQNNIIRGQGHRIFPVEQAYRNWNIFGIVHDSFLSFNYWANIPQKSSGCVHLKLKNDYIYEGYYLGEHNGKIDQTAIKFYKQINT